MNRKQFFPLIVLVLAVGGVGLYLYKKSASDWQSSGGSLGQKLVPNFPVNDVGQLIIRQATNEVNLVKNQDRWVVKERNNYPANFSDISDFVRKTADLKIVQSVKVGPSQRPRLELVEPGTASGSGTLVEFKDGAGKSLQKLLLGKKHMRKSASPSPSPMGMGDEAGFPDGRYILNLQSGADNVAVVSDPLTQVEPKPEQWLEKEFFKIEKPRSIEMLSTNGTNSWKITRETETSEWVLANTNKDETLDPAKVSGMSTAFSSPSFSDVAVNIKAEESGLAKPVEITMETFDGFTYKIDVGNKSGEDNYYFAVKVSGNFPKERTAGKDEKPEDKEKLDREWKEKNSKLEEKLTQEKAYGAWTYLAPRWTVDSVIKDRHQLLIEKKAETQPEGGAANPAPLTIPDPLQPQNQ